jgi:hypothetical protein
VSAPSPKPGPGQSHWTWRYYRDREIAYGRRWWISQDPELAAEQLAQYRGGIRRAEAWARELLEALQRRAA